MVCGATREPGPVPPRAGVQPPSAWDNLPTWTGAAARAPRNAG